MHSTYKNTEMEMAWHFAPGVQKLVQSFVRVWGERYMLFHNHMLKPFPCFLHHLSYTTNPTGQATFNRITMSDANDFALSVST